MRNKESRRIHYGGLGTKIKDIKPRRNYWGNLYEEDTDWRYRLSLYLR